MHHNPNALFDSHDVLFLVLDALRYDVAVTEMAAGRTPVLEGMVGAWEMRHSPGSFTFAAHQAFFAGFLPTPADPQIDKTRLFACRFPGSETTGDHTKVFEQADWIHGLASEGYRTLCVGGVGFFNKQTALGEVLPGYFEQSEWRSEFGVTNRDSARQQFTFAAEWLGQLQAVEKALVFINVSAIHQPNYFYERDEGADDLSSHAAALRYVDSQLPILLEGIRRRSRKTFYIVTSDHGTAYGEDGWQGHRMAHEVVWTVPYAEGIL